MLWKMNESFSPWHKNLFQPRFLGLVHPKINEAKARMKLGVERNQFLSNTCKWLSHAVYLIIWKIGKQIHF